MRVAGSEGREFAVIHALQMSKGGQRIFPVLESLLVSVRISKFVSVRLVVLIVRIALHVVHFILEEVRFGSSAYLAKRVVIRQTRQ